MITEATQWIRHSMEILAILRITRTRERCNPTTSDAKIPPLGTQEKFANWPQVMEKPVNPSITGMRLYLSRLDLINKRGIPHHSGPVKVGGRDDTLGSYG